MVWSQRQENRWRDWGSQSKSRPMPSLRGAIDVCPWAEQIVFCGMQFIATKVLSN